MKHEKWKKLEEKIKMVSIIVSLLITIGGVVIGLFNYYTLNQLAPLSTRIKQVEATQTEVAEELKVYQAEHAALLEKLATKEQVSGLITRVDKISGRVDQVIGILLR